MSDREFKSFGEGLQLGCGMGRHDTAAGVEQGPAGRGKLGSDAFGHGRVKGGTRKYGRNLNERADGEIGRENVHRDIHEDGAGPAGRGEMKGAFDDAGKILHAVDPVDSFAERTVDLVLVGVSVQIDFLVRMAAVVMGRDVA